MTIGKWMDLNPVERSRTYIYPAPYCGVPNSEITFTNVTALYVSENGTHYLECEQGKVITRCGWMAIKLDIDSWTYPKKPSVDNV